MTITASTAVFPNNVVNLLDTRFKTIDKDLRTFKRPLRPSDPAQSVGTYAGSWMPDQDSFEIGGRPSGVHQSTLSSYLIVVQAFVKDFDEERGLAVHSVLSKFVRSMLYNDDALRVGLRALSVVMDGSTERTQKFGVRNVRYQSNEINEEFLYLSTLEFWLETETI